MYSQQCCTPHYGYGTIHIHENTPTSPENLRLAKDEFEHMINLGITRPSSNPLASPFHIITYKDSDDWRPTSDYRRLNAKTISHRYPPLHIRYLIASLKGTTVFFKNRVG